MCGLEVQRSRVEAALLVLELKLSLNLRDRTIEELLTKMRSSHVSLVDMLLDEFRLAGAPLKALAPLTICREEALNEQPSEYNDPRHYSKRTQKALDAQEQVFELVSEARMWDGETPHSSHASTPQRGASPPPPEEAAPSNDAPASNGVAPVPSSGGESTGASEPASVGAASKRMSISLRDAPGDSVGEPTGKRHVERNLWALARKGMHDYLRNREKAHKQFSLARLCALHNHSDSAIKLLQMSLHNWPLRDESPRARIVQAALHAAGAKEEHRWRLEAAVLTDGMQQPWPSTMCTLIVRANDDNLTTAFAMLVAALEESSRFTVGARVLVWTPTPTTASADEGTWENGTITQLRWSDRKDVRLDNGMVLMARPLEHVLAVSEGGPGACLRSASKRGANMLMQAMLERGISPFEANLNGTTALHRAAKSGLVDTCKLLLNARADGYMANSAGASPFGEALTKGHMAVVRLFQPLLSDLDVTEFAHTGAHGRLDAKRTPTEVPSRCADWRCCRRDGLSTLRARAAGSVCLPRRRTPGRRRSHPADARRGARKGRQRQRVGAARGRAVQHLFREQDYSAHARGAVWPRRRRQQAHRMPREPARTLEARSERAADGGRDRGARRREGRARTHRGTDATRRRPLAPTGLATQALARKQRAPLRLRVAGGAQPFSEPRRKRGSRSHRERTVSDEPSDASRGRSDAHGPSGDAGRRQRPRAQSAHHDRHSAG